MNYENKNHKDNVFRALYRSKRRLLELYNAINHTNYTNTKDLTIRTLNGMTFLGMKNDVSFIFDSELNLYEHNSTPCPNIPLRYLYYIASSLKQLIPLKELYKESMVKIPVPRFYVFYNGTKPIPDRFEYKLSDMYEKKIEEPGLELVTTVLNINEGHNKELMNACKTLREYSIYVAKVRKYMQEAKRTISADEYNIRKNALIKEIVIKTIDECIEEDILKDFFISNRKEAINMSILDCTAEEQLQVLTDESYDKGVSIGVSIGVSQGTENTTDFFAWLYKNGRDADAKKAASNKKSFDKLFKEYKAATGKKSNKE